jgi:NTP pyrophosphatase (non-canonical NTP hydrolase)
MQITIEGLERYLQNHYGSWANEQGLFMKLVEEMGEVAEILNKRAGRKSPDGSDLQQELGKELADMIHYIVAIAAVNNLDLNELILSKDRQASAKYHREENLETFLAKQNTR